MKSRFNKFLLFIVGYVLVTVSANAAQTALEKVMKKRHLTEMDVLAAAKTYNPSGVHDKYVIFSSGGQSGQVIVYGVPSMRILKYIGVFTPEPWQGYGYEEDSLAVLRQGNVRGKEINWGDTHHPGLSETDGKYDGKWLFINDKAHPRIAVIDLKDFETKQIVVNPVFKSEHGGSFVTPNTDYILEASQYAAPFSNDFVPLSEYNEVYRGGVTMWKFDKKKGRIDAKKSFTLELPPYAQDLTDAGKNMSDGWAFTNSFNAERYVGTFGVKGSDVSIRTNNIPNEAGMSRNETDYMHVYNWKKLAKLAKNKKNVKIYNGHKVIPIDIAVKNNALFLIPETKSPHGVDVSPSGQYIIVCGKLDPHASVYDFKKIMKLIKNKDYEGRDPYGIPILSLKKTLHGKVELGLGPLHTQFSPKDGEVYTSLYVDSAIAKWNYKTLKLISKQGVHYNIGHLAGMEGKTADPQGEYIIALNKLSIDRFTPVGPLLPQNHQLIDISGDKMQMLVDMPLPLGEPHQAVGIRASKLKTAFNYSMGTNSRTGKISKGAVKAGQERITRVKQKDGTYHVTVYGTSIRSHISPEIIKVNKGDKVTIYMTNLERVKDETHGFTIDNYGKHMSLEPGKTANIEFIADMEGVFPYYCTEFCSALHLEMMGYFLVVDPTKTYKSSAKRLKDKKLSSAQLKKKYKKVVDVNKKTDAIIQSVVKFLKDNKFQDHKKVAALVGDALDQYGKIPAQKKRANTAFKAGKIEDAILLEGLIWQYMVKTADVGLRARSLLVDKLSTKQSKAAARGEEAFRTYGCNGCHVIGKPSSGPDLTGVLFRHGNVKKSERWVTNFILNPEKMYDEPYVKAMIGIYNLKMPNQGVPKKEAKNIIEYFKWVDENAHLN